MSVQKHYEQVGAIRNAANKINQIRQGGTSDNAGAARNLFFVLITSIDTTQGFNIYTCELYGLNGAATGVFHTATALDNASSFLVGDKAAMFIDQMGRRVLINAGGGGSVDLPAHTHAFTVSAT